MARKVNDRETMIMLLGTFSRHNYEYIWLRSSFIWKNWKHHGKCVKHKECGQKLS